MPNPRASAAKGGQRSGAAPPERTYRAPRLSNRTLGHLEEENRLAAKKACSPEPGARPAPSPAAEEPSEAFSSPKAPSEAFSDSGTTSFPTSFQDSPVRAAGPPEEAPGSNSAHVESARIRWGAQDVEYAYDVSLSHDDISSLKEDKMTAAQSESLVRTHSETLSQNEAPTSPRISFIPSASDDTSTVVVNGCRVKRALTNMSVPEMTSFDDLALLRGSLLADVLHNQASILKASIGSKDTYALSHKVKIIDVFLSHNWATPRIPKFLVLVIHFNWAPALAVSMAVLVLCSLLTSAGVAPVVDTSVGECGVLGIILPAPTFVLTLLNWHEMPRFVWPGNSVVFLDKTCIHQSDEVLKRQGIEKLGAFLVKSTTLLCCFTELYLMQLWTIYELATFLILHPLDRISVLPTYVPPSVLLGVGLSYVSSCTVFFFPSDLDLVPVVLTYFPVMTMIAYNALMRFCAHKRAAIRESVQQFRIRKAKCSNEEDRALVEGNVADMLRYFSFVEEAADDDAALDEFDRMVHAAVPRAVVKSLGHSGLPYRYQVCCCLLLILPVTFEITAADVRTGRSSGWKPLLLVFQTTVHAVTTLPLSLALGARATGLQISAGPRTQVTIVLTTAVTAFCFGMALLRADTEFLQARAAEDISWTAALAAFDLLLLALTFLAYEGSCNYFGGPCQRRDMIGSAPEYPGYLVPSEEAIAAEDCVGLGIHGAAGPDTVTIN